MSKILKCPICGKLEPRRNDAKVCSVKCRVKKWRRKKLMEKNKREKELSDMADYLEDSYTEPEPYIDPFPAGDWREGYP